MEANLLPGNITGKPGNRTAKLDHPLIWKVRIFAKADRNLFCIFNVANLKSDYFDHSACVFLCNVISFSVLLFKSNRWYKYTLKY